MKRPKVRGIFSGARGQRIFNILYSIGASIVILGALFKILHAYGADIMLIVGMGTEAIIFFLSAFDEQQMGTGEETSAEVAAETEEHSSAPAQPIIIQGGTVGQPIVVGQPVAQPAVQPVQPVASSAPFVPVQPTPAVTPLNSKEAAEATEEYVKQLTELNETLAKLQTSLSQNLQGLNAMYELQLRDAGSQLNAVNQVNKETEQMSETIKQLNVIYERMLNAMKN